MGGACNMRGTDEKWLQNFYLKTQREEILWKT
jgi:hypothetical protein